MTDTKAILKWFTIPTLIVVTQILLDTIDAFESFVVFLAFLVLSILTLYVWRSRFEKALKALMPPDGYPNVETVKQAPLSDQRFAVWSMMSPFAILMFAQLAIVIVLSLKVSIVQTYAGYFWTVFGVLAFGFFQIAMFIRYLIVRHSRRWQRILTANFTRPTEP